MEQELFKAWEIDRGDDTNDSSAEYIHRFFRLVEERPYLDVIKNEKKRLRVPTDKLFPFKCPGSKIAGSKEMLKDGRRNLTLVSYMLMVFQLHPALDPVIERDGIERGMETD